MRSQMILVVASIGTDRIAPGIPHIQSARADAVSVGALCSLFELHHGRLDVLTSRTFEGAEIEPWLRQRDTLQIHLCRAHLALWPCISSGVFKRVFGKRHLRLP
jgi:hypothetical protein